MFPAAHEHAAGSVVSEAADGNRLKRIPASESAARKSPASAEPAVAAFGSFEEEYDATMTSGGDGAGSLKLVFAPIETSDAVVLDDRPALEASSTTAEPHSGEAEGDQGSDADSRDGETEPKRRKMTIDERERWLTRQSALSDALAAASESARELRGGPANATAAPVARGRSDSPAATGTETLADRTAEEALRLPGGTYDMARLVAEDDAFVRLARMPRENVSDAAGPLPPPVLPWSNRGAWRPRILTDVYTGAGVKLIVGWYAEMAAHEQLGKMKGGSGLRRPDDLVLGDEFAQPAARGRPWFLLDHIRSGGKKPIMPLEEAGVTEEVLQGARIRSLGEDYHNKAVLGALTSAEFGGVTRPARFPTTRPAHARRGRRRSVAATTCSRRGARSPSSCRLESRRGGCQSSRTAAGRGDVGGIPRGHETRAFSDDETGARTTRSAALGRSNDVLAARRSLAVVVSAREPARWLAEQQNGRRAR